MPFSKIKSIALAILVAVNLLLLAIVLPARQEELNRQQTVRTNLQQLFAACEVALEPELIPTDLTLYPLLLEPDSAAQEAAAEVLLGEEFEQTEESGRYTAVYETERGTCEFSRSGTVAVTLTQPLESSSINLQRDAQKLLAQMGFACEDAGEPQRQSAAVYTVTARQQISGVPVFSGALTLSYSNDALTGITGEYFTGADSAVMAEQTACIGCADALIAFLNSRDALGWVGGRIDAVEQGYLLVETASATTIRLNPAWRIQTDTGIFFVNGLTGEVSAAD